jgi:hypothetical protein
LASIPGRPKLVVTDGSGVWAKAVPMAWPDVFDPATGELLEATPQMLGCECHWRERLRSALRATGVLPPRELEAARPDPTVPWPMNHRRRLRVQAIPAEPGSAWTPGPSRNRTGYHKLDRGRNGELRLAAIPDGDTHPLLVAADKAFDSAADWDAMAALATRWQARPLGHWLKVNGPAIRAQLAGRRPGVPRSIGGLEASLRVLKRMLHDRAHLLTNTDRTNRMLDLVTLQMRGVASEREYTRRILETASSTTGRVPRQRSAVDVTQRLHR